MSDKGTAEPAPKGVTALEGKTTADEGMSFEPGRLAYRAAERIAEAIAWKLQASRIGPGSERTVIVAGVDLLVDFANLSASLALLEGIQRDYESIKPPSAGNRAKLLGAPPALASMVTPVQAAVETTIGLLSLFREDTDYRGSKASIDALAFEMAIAGKLKELKVKSVIVPALFIVSRAKTTEQCLFGCLRKAQVAKAEAWQRVGPDISQLIAAEARLSLAIQSKDAEAEHSETAKVTELRRDLEPLSEALGQADRRLTDLESIWNKADPETGLTALGRLIRAEAIRDHSPEPVYVHASIVLAGGYNRVSRSLFRTMFFGDGLSSVGGTVARWALVESDGTIVDGGILDARDHAGPPGWMA